MELRLGTHVFDVSTQAVVVATIDSAVDSDVEVLRNEGADALMVGNDADLGRHVERAKALDIPLITNATEGDGAKSCLKAGAVAICGGVLTNPTLLPMLAERDASVLIVDYNAKATVATLVERARWAQAAGMAKSQIFVQAQPDQVAELAAYGYPVAIATSEGDETAQGTHVAAVMNGARIIRSNNVRATKRTVSTVSELLQRRGTVAPNAVEFAGGR